MDFVVKWRLRTAGSFWPVDVVRAESVFVCNGKNDLPLSCGSLGVYLVMVYQKYLRPFVPTSCRFEPSCSEYTKQSILKYGLTKGVFKGLIRILRCHPFSGKSGYDPLI